jgi:hypothetical protein
MAIENPTALLIALSKQHPRIAATSLAPQGLRAIIGTASNAALIEACVKVQDAVMAAWNHKAWTSQAITLSAMDAFDGDLEEAFAYLSPHLSKWRGLTFQYNANGRRHDKPVTDTDREVGILAGKYDSEMATMEEELREALERAGRKLAAMADPAGEPGEPGEPTPADPTDPADPAGEPITVDEDGDEPITTPEPPQATPEPTGILAIIRERFSRYGRTIDHLRTFSATRKDLASLDSMRLNIDGRKLIAHGLPEDGLIANVCSHMGPDSLAQAGVEKFDWAVWGNKLPKGQRAGKFEHAATPAIIVSIKAGVPTWIWGGAGIGKSVGVYKAAEILKEELGRPDYRVHELNLSGQTAAAITGRDRLKEFVESNFTAAMRDGYLWLGEEIDNADPRVLTLINNCIANGIYSNPVTGEEWEIHKDARVVVTANTNGQGAAAGFIRNKIDRASIDRFAVGMFHLALDRRLERNITQAQEAEFLAAIEAGDLMPIGF